MHFFVAKLLSLAVMTYTYVHHVGNLRPTIRQIYYAHVRVLEWVCGKDGR